MVQDSIDWANPAVAGITLESLHKAGYARLNLPPSDRYAPHAEGNFPTPSGKCEFESSMAAGGNFVVPLFRQGSNEFQDGTPVPALPTYVPPNESARTSPALAKRYPLSLISPKSHAFLNSSYGNLPEQLRHAQEQFVTLHPGDASARNIPDGARVRVFNDRGAFQATARISADVMNGVAMAPLGYWRKSSHGQATVNAVNPPSFTDLGRGPTFSDTLVEVALTN
jgi:anaerobic selenocysteine-containing dehydrogenase